MSEIPAPDPDPGGAPVALAHALLGRRVLVTRGGAAGDKLATIVRSYGAEPVVSEVITHAPPADPAPFERAVARWNTCHYDWLAVTSARAVDALVEAGAQPGHARVAAVGPATVEALSTAGFEVDLTPATSYTGEALGAALARELTEHPVANGRARVLLPLSEIAENSVETALEDAGQAPDRVTAYRTIPVEGDPATDSEVAAHLDAVLVLSSSGARAIAARFTPLPAHTVIAAIGEPTAAELARLGLAAHVIASEHTAPGLVAALATHYAAQDPHQHLTPTVSTEGSHS